MRWVTLNEFPNYEINLDGIVRNISTKKVFKATKNNHGYLHLNLIKNGRYYTRKIHRLLAISFLPNPQNLPCINHKDGNKRNNDLCNLEWCNAKYNINHAVKTGLWESHSIANKKRSKFVIDINTGVFYTNVAEVGNLFNLSPQKVYKMIYKGNRYKYV